MKTLEEKVVEYLKKREFGGSTAWWDKSRVYYELTAKEIVNVCKYLNRNKH
jgi:hypothetical protein